MLGVYGKLNICRHPRRSSGVRYCLFSYVDSGFEHTLYNTSTVETQRGACRIHACHLSTNGVARAPAGRHSRWLAAMTGSSSSDTDDGQQRFISDSVTRNHQPPTCPFPLKIPSCNPCSIRYNAWKRSGWNMATNTSICSKRIVSTRLHAQQG